MSLVAVGDNCMDVYPDLGCAFPGGNALNVAVQASRLGCASAYVGFIGDDDPGQGLSQAVRREGVDCSHLHVLPGRTASTQVRLSGGERSFEDYDEGVQSRFCLDEADLDFIRGFRGVHSGLWGRAAEYFPRFRAMGLVTCYDFSENPERASLEPLLPAVDYAFVSCPEPGGPLQDFLHWAITRGPKAVVATLGGQGSLALDAQGLHRFGVVPGPVLNTMGAGDAYIAGFMVRILNGGTLPEAMTAGMEQAGKAVAVFGAW